ncbi:MAG: Ppx/GppA phosphatase family protein [Acidimicrobiaceae bacterium]|nr:Ppx/GppA phosphatase family protein [Acidimicrobiaceae bacterium]
MTRHPVAVIDCGTNTTRLLITQDISEPPFARLCTITRLGRGVDATGELNPAAIERTLGCLRDYRAHMDRYDVAAVRATATSAVRDATNRNDFLNAAADVVGSSFEVLSGQQEAFLSFQGAVSDLNVHEGPFLVVDIGGGSTELAYGNTEIESALSLDIGSVRLTEKYLHSDPPSADELSACLSLVGLHLDDAVRIMGSRLFDSELVGVAGTVSTVAAVEIGLVSYDRERLHHFALSKEAVEDVFRTLATESLVDRMHNPGLESGRADVIVAGVCILAQFMRFFGFEECLVSERDLLDGLARSLLQSDCE